MNIDRILRELKKIYTYVSKNINYTIFFYDKNDGE